MTLHQRPIPNVRTTLSVASPVVHTGVPIDGWEYRAPLEAPPPPQRDAVEGKGPQRPPQRRLNRRLEEVTVGSKCHRAWQLPSGRQWLGIGWAPWRGRGVPPPPFQCIPPPPPLLPPRSPGGEGLRWPQGGWRAQSVHHVTMEYHKIGRPPASVSSEPVECQNPQSCCCCCSLLLLLVVDATFCSLYLWHMLLCSKCRPRTSGRPRTAFRVQKR